MRLCTGILLVTLSLNCMAGVEEVFEVKNVGASANTGTVFIDSSTAATQSNCVSKSHLKISISDPMAEMFYSAAVVAKTSDRKLLIGYESSECLHGAVKVKMFKLVD